jgi:cation diffusion facilitator CzcD-associated flavoprotein CzcO
MKQLSMRQKESFINHNFDYDVVIIGAGISGLYQLYKLRQLGLRVCVFEAGDGIGGTWHWNRYPGARFDSESYSYAYSFSQELLDEWNWSEHFASQPEILRYLEHVADKFDLLRNIHLASPVKAAKYDDHARSWTVILDGGDSYTTRVLITAVGILSQPTLPSIEGMDSFKGSAFHTSRWPKEQPELKGQNVAVIGTGASGVQAIQELAKDVGHLTVFQRRPNWCAPLRNGKITSDEMQDIKASYPAMFEQCRTSQAGFIWTVDPRGTFEVTPEERNAFWEKLYASKGMAIWQGNFKDILVDPNANLAISEFIEAKIRARVHNPVTADMLIPKDHGFGTRRVPLETHYYEVYNQSNVDLINIVETPIIRITEGGIVTSNEEFTFDTIVYATGFDALGGSFDKIAIEGTAGSLLKDKWDAKMETYVALQVFGYPNMLMINGPQGLGGNHPVNIQYTVEWIADLVKHMIERDLTRAEATPEGIETWNRHINDKSSGSLMNGVDSWMTGVNKNVEGKGVRILGARYGGSVESYRGLCDEVASNGYEAMNLS